ncbi:hypothetical protein WICMUC_001636 [Wickerhamomyces mucosus]|uniref:Uncharacterized protein n=1 Tax=Wickerhamomyces mucosus TaxID=1378264 RepID=A0A9P8PV75_9ASCO|nr:hypothetical protein WICMUC_001636 [Wickerhamomyces mucosus]
MIYTKIEKQRIIQRFGLQKIKIPEIQRKKALEDELSKIGDLFESKIQRRINLVPKKFTELKIKDVLNVERDHKIKLYELIKDIKNQQMKNDVMEQELENKVDPEKLKRLEQVKNKRKQSMNIGGR